MLRRLLSTASTQAALKISKAKHNVELPVFSKGWKPELTTKERSKLKWLRIASGIRPKLLTPLNTSQASDASLLEKKDFEIIEKIQQERSLYACIKLNTRPYLVTKNDIIICKHLPDCSVGDVLNLNNVHEVGGKSWYIRNKEQSISFVSVKAVVLEHGYSAKYETKRKRVGKGGGDRKFRKISRRDQLTYLRITSIVTTVNSTNVTTTTETKPSNELRSL